MISIDNENNQIQFELAIKNLSQLISQVEQVKKAFGEIGAGTGDNVSKGFTKAKKSVEETEEKIKLLTQQIREAEKEAEKMFTSDGNNGAFRKQAEAVRKLKVELAEMKAYLDPKSFAEPFEKQMSAVQKVTKEVSALKNALVEARASGNTNLASQLETEIRQRQKLMSLTTGQKTKEDKPVSLITKNELDELATAKQMIRDLENQKIRFNEQSNPYMAGRTQAQINALKQSYSEVKPEKETVEKPVVPATYSQQLSKLSLEAQGFYQTWQKTKDVNDKLKFDDKVSSFRKLRDESDAFSKSLTGTLEKQTGYLGSFMQKFRSHFNWIVAGAALGSLFAIPLEALSNLKEIEQGMAGMKQVIPELHDNQEQLNKSTIEFLNIAEQYGASMGEITESAKLWGRAYKDINEVYSLLHSSSLLAVADNFSLTEANKALEATMMQYGMRARDANEAQKLSMKIVDSWTNVAHNAIVSAQDLAAANERSASAAKQAGVSFDFLQGMIATMARNTGRSGGEIGNAIRSMLVSLHSDKAIKEIEKLGVSMYEVGENGKKAFRDTEKVLIDLMLTSDATDKNVEKLMLSISGGKFQYNKVASLIGDYNELIRTIELSINSQGVAEKQAEMQVDTISRKLQRLGTQLQEIVMGAGNSGLTKFIKGVIDDINVLIGRLTTIPASVWQNIGTIVEYTIYVKAAITVWNLGAMALTLYNKALNDATIAKTAESTATSVGTLAQGAANVATTVATGAKEAEAVATVELTMAERALAIARTISTGGLNLLIPLIIAGTTAYALFNTQSAEAVKQTQELTSAVEKENARLEDKASATEAELGLNESRIKFANELKDAYQRLTEQQKQLEEQRAQGLNVADKIKANDEKIATTEHALTSMLGEEAIQRIKNSADVGQQIDVEIAKMNDKKKTLTEQLQEERKAIVDHSMEVADQAKQRLKAIQQETQGLATEAEKQIEIYRQLGLTRLADLKAKNEADKQTVVAADNGWTKLGMIGYGGQFGTMFADQNKQNAINQEKKSAQDLADGLVSAQTEQNQIITKAANEVARIKAQEGTKIDDIHDTGTVEDTPPKKRTSIDPIDNTKLTQEKLQLLAFKQQEANINLKLKQTADDYAIALDNIATKENLQGKSAETWLDKRMATQEQIRKLSETVGSDKTLGTEASKGTLTQLENDLRWQLAELEKNMPEFKDVDFSKLSKKGQKELNQDHSELLSESQVTQQIYQMWIKIQEQISSTTKEISKQKNSLIQLDTAGYYSTEQVLNRQLEASKRRQEMEKLGYKDSTSPFKSMKMSDSNLKYAREQRGIQQGLLDKKTSDYEDTLEAYNNISAYNEKGELKTDKEQSDERKKYQEKIDAAKEAMEKQKLVVLQADQEIKNYEQEKNKAILDGWYDLTDKVLLKGNKFKDTLKNLWSQMAEDALKALMGVENTNVSWLTKLSNKWFGGSSGTKQDYSSVDFNTEDWTGFASGNKHKGLQPVAVTDNNRKSVNTNTVSALGADIQPLLNKPSISADSATAEESKPAWLNLANIDVPSFSNSDTSSEGLQSGTLSESQKIAEDQRKRKLQTSSSNSSNWWNLLSKAVPLFAHEDGGIFNQEHVATLNEGNKAEAVIPLTDQSRGQSLVMQSAQALGMLNKGTQVAPYLSEKTQETLKNNNSLSVNLKQSQEHIAAIESTNNLLMTQNQMILEILNKQSSKGNTTTQPIVMQQAQSDDDLYSQISRMRNLGYSV